MEIKATNFFLNNPFATPDSEVQLGFIYSALQEFKKLKVPVSTACNVVKSIASVEKAIKEYETTRLIICESLCNKDENGKPIVEENKYKFTKESHDEFNRKWQDLLNTEITLDIWQINQSDIKDVKEINISCYETLLKYGFIVE